MKIRIPVSAGELVDKLTILELKSSKIKDKDKKILITLELNDLQKAFDKICKNIGQKKKELMKLKQNLLNVNKRLWKIEDEIRKHEIEGKFGTDFIELARSVYINNDNRSALKNKINILLGSDMREVKQYTKY